MSAAILKHPTLAHIRSSVVIPWLVRGGPNVREGDGRVKSIKDAEGQGNVTKEDPDDVAVELLALCLLRHVLDLHSLPEVDCHVGDDEESDQVATWLAVLKSITN